MERSLDLTLYLVTNRYEYTDSEFLSIVEEACQAGVSLVQLREKSATTRQFFELGKKVKAITDAYDIPLIINDRVDICLALDASGVHIGDDELPIAITRQLIGENKWLGVSTKTVTSAVRAEQLGADYLGVGAIFSTTTKEDATVTSLAELQAICEQVTIPVVAIGGITEQNMLTFESYPIAGVSLISDVMLAESVTKKVRALNTNLQKILGKEEY
ncbi:thiamine phosphate synthase [Vagococcus penaei]|uniref:Thiamine-phosphate synthase n=1 Tax=Vagococcus penaei TaxID=633807 RepID=A0A1Q2D337_9ENTE|nr:thiamine phosphate synthase [Vagococcus penaei]AQP52772.1 thiamine-phosphate diphosphorylase [Vagococcus penaei]RST98460.1 thiamine phosphate synthase [Vagococcus penaei]